MIDPNNIINFNRSRAQKEELLLFLVCVAGKKASTVVKQLDKFLKVGGATYQMYVNRSPFEIIRLLDTHGSLLERLKNYGFGQHTKLERAFRELANSNLNLDTCTLSDLMSIHGIGRKSASCYLAWTRKGEKVAMLDTHLLKYLVYFRNFAQSTTMQELDFARQYSDTVIPKSTPSSKKLYDSLENFYLQICEYMNVNPTEFDLEIWKHYSQGLDKTEKGGILK